MTVVYKPIGLSPILDDYDPEAVEPGNASVRCGYCDFNPFCSAYFGSHGKRCLLPRPFVYKQKDYRVKGVCDGCRATCADWLAVDGSRRLCAACYYREVHGPSLSVCYYHEVHGPSLNNAVPTPGTYVDVCWQQAQTIEGLRKTLTEKDAELAHTRGLVNRLAAEKRALEEIINHPPDPSPQDKS